MKNIKNKLHRVISWFTAFAVFALTLPGLSSISSALSFGSSISDYANVVIFAYFQDDAAGADHFGSSENAEKYINAYNGTQKRSVTSYLDTISYGKFHIHNYFPQYDSADNTINAVQLPYNTAQAVNGNIDGAIISYVKENVAVDPSLNIDQNNDGFVDNITVILYYNGSTSNSNSTLSSHKSDHGDPSDTMNGKIIGTYNMISTKATDDGSNTGVICHEFLHSIGYSDLYTTSGDGPGPVAMWDIMSSANEGMSWPLAYTRMYFTNWVSIDTITQNGTYTLNLQSKIGGKAAYIIKSPYNDQELFVVEFRKKSSSPDEIERHIGNSGMIVYRVDTTVEKLSNYFGKTGIYVFRPKEDSTQNAQACAYNAALSVENGRTSIGSKDPDATLDDGALTFKDGSNSGIVISNVSSAAGEQMTFTVEIYNLAELVWDNTNFTDSSSDVSKKVSICSLNGAPYAAVGASGAISLYTRSGSSWAAAAPALSASYISNVKLESCDGSLYLAYSDFTYLYIYKYASRKWNLCGKIRCSGDFSLDGSSGQLFASYITGDGMELSARWAVVYDDCVIDNGAYYDGLCGQCELICHEGAMYAFVREASGILKIYSLTENGPVLIKQFSANVYDAASQNDGLYVMTGNALAGESISVNVLRSGVWSTISTECPTNAARLISAGSDVYIMSSDSTRTRAYKLNSTRNGFEKFASDIDSASGCMELALAGNDLYAALVRDSDKKVVIKKKTIEVNHVTPASTTTTTVSNTAPVTTPAATTPVTTKAPVVTTTPPTTTKALTTTTKALVTTPAPSQNLSPSYGSSFGSSSFGSSGFGSSSFGSSGFGSSSLGSSGFGSSSLGSSGFGSSSLGSSGFGSSSLGSSGFGSSSLGSSGFGSSSLGSSGFGSSSLGSSGFGSSSLGSSGFGSSSLGSSGFGSSSFGSSGFGSSSLGSSGFGSSSLGSSGFGSSSFGSSGFGSSSLGSSGFGSSSFGSSGFGSSGFGSSGFGSSSFGSSSFGSSGFGSSSLGSSGFGSSSFGSSGFGSSGFGSSGFGSSSFGSSGFGSSSFGSSSLGSSGFGSSGYGSSGYGSSYGSSGYGSSGSFGFRRLF